MAIPFLTSPRPRPKLVIPSRKGLAPSKIVVAGDKGLKICRSVTIRKDEHSLYVFWRELENLVRLVPRGIAVTPVSHIEYHWSLCDAAGNRCMEWDTLIINDEPDRLIAWRSSDTSEIANAGTVRFVPAPGDEGTEITVTLDYTPPKGGTDLLPKFSREDARLQLADMLRRFKALMETGEIPTIDAQSAGEPQRKHAK